MSEYTPTTEEVRDRAIWLSEKAFDRWLAEVKAEAWDEGERRGRDNERELSRLLAFLRTSEGAQLHTNPYRGEK